MIAGMLAGGRLEHAFHRPASAQANEETLIILFQDGERLTVTQPMGVERTLEGDLMVAQGSGATFSWRPRTAPDDPEAEYLEIYRVTRQGYAFLGKILHDRSLVAGQVDPDPTMVSLGGPGRPFVRITKITGA